MSRAFCLQIRGANSRKLMDQDQSVSHRGKVQLKPGRTWNQGPPGGQVFHLLTLYIPFIVPFFFATNFLCLSMGNILLHSSACLQCGQVGNRLANQPLSQIFIPVFPFPFSYYPLQIHNLKSQASHWPNFVQGPTTGTIN